ncbi:AraC family transcriptional regulator [Pseudoduganella ginsengisoli]|uniref:Helix-turn-helix domain-containing protein n=1 Tax=Pseudoduganella ginsengisoli TaxID=1462440 RepID=A0A6L6PVL6_9BURK|nr:helix-turn-helix domain-containing protein [Pseudoduganella ginsengisoli]MTW01261.1 helix-turn-helix domain-containing protein [Pseudoduganella ginsengisoli]
MYYEELSPSPALRPYVACLWRSASAGAPAGASHRVLPDNCIDILWQDAGRAAFAVGMMTRAIHVPLGLPVRTVAVRFRPGAAGLFLGVPLHELTDLDVAVTEFRALGDVGRLSDQLWLDGIGDAGRLRLIEQHLLSRLQYIAPAGALVGAALAALDHSGGALRIESLVEQLGVSRQHLAAQFRTHVGLSPKLYARIQRFRRATDLLKQPSPATVDWAQLALDCGYFDQSHLINDFREFADCTPESFGR